MASGQWSSVVRQVNRLWTSGTAVGQTEAQLLERFASGDESAFETLVARHGPMVHGVCRRLLRDPNDADDAFQATFLVLARKAGTIGDREALASWLYGVARRVSARARTDASIRRRREAAANPDRPASLDAAHQAQRRELVETVQSEVDRLPASSRAVVVLCDLSGCTHEEAAARLGWPLGTVKGRHFRARNLLRDRLARRGLAPSAILSVLAAASEARPVVPRALLETTTRAACAYATGRLTLAGLAATHATHLAQGVTKTMFIHQIQWATAATLTAALLTAGAGVVAQGVGTNAKPGEPSKAATIGPIAGPTKPESSSATTPTTEEVARPAPSEPGSPKPDASPATTTARSEVIKPDDARKREKDAHTILSAMTQTLRAGGEIDSEQATLWLGRLRRAQVELDAGGIAAAEKQVRTMEEAVSKSDTVENQVHLLQAKTYLADLKKDGSRAWDQYSNLVQILSPEQRKQAGIPSIISTRGQIIQPRLAPDETNNQFQTTSNWLSQFRDAAKLGVEIPRDRLKNWLDLYEQSSEAMTAKFIEQYQKAARDAESTDPKARWRAAETIRVLVGDGGVVPENEDDRLMLEKMRIAAKIAQVQRGGEQTKHAFDDLRGLLLTGKYSPLAPEDQPKPAQASLTNVADGPGKTDGGPKPGVNPAETTPKDQVSLEGGVKEPGPIAEVRDDPAAKAMARRLAAVIIPEIGDDAASKAVGKRLATVIDADFTKPTELDELLKYLKDKTKGDDAKELRFYIESEGMLRGGGMGSNEKAKFTLDLHDVPAHLAFRLALRQLSLVYFVRDGLIYITLGRDAESLEATIRGSGIERSKPAPRP